MITPTTLYRTTDGSEFRTHEAATAYESRAERLTALLSRLPALPEGTGFSNGEGYLQHDYDTAVSVMNEVLTIMEERVGKSHGETGWDSWILQTRTKGPREAHPSWVGRLISDYDDKALNRAWSRFMCINWTTMREYGQQYYAAHPDEARGGCLNPEARS